MPRKSKTVQSVNYEAEMLDLLSKLPVAIQASQEIKLQYENKLIEVEERDKNLAEYELKLKQREGELREKEAGFSAKEKDINDKVRRIMTVNEAKEKMEEADIKDGRAAKMMAEAMEKLKEVEIREEQIHEAERKLTQERGEYKQRVRQEILDNFLKK